MQGIKLAIDRLWEKGKNKNAALIADCNKLLKIVFGVSKTEHFSWILLAKNSLKKIVFLHSSF